MINKKALVEKYAKEYEITKKQAEQNIEEVCTMIQKAVVEDGGIDLYGFMKIEKVHKEESTARSPKTGETVKVPAKDVPKAKFSSRFKKAVNNEI